MSTRLDQIAREAKEDKDRQFLSVAHLLTEEALERAFRSLRKEASAGVDGLTYRDYERDLTSNLAKLHEELRNQQYRSRPLRRTYIAKEDGKRRPLSIPCVEDKIVQKAAVELMEAIYEVDFLDCSFGFRPGRGCHDALQRLREHICLGRISYVLEADIRAYFDSIVRSQLMEMLERRIRDSSLLHLVGKWLHAGVLEDDQLLITKTGTGQGQPISPLLANIYLHYVLDVWFMEQVKPRMRGEAHLVRYADDFVLCFQYRDDAQKVLDALHLRFNKFGLQLHPDKTRLLAFGRFADDQAKRQGKRHPDTFDFLGFTHTCSRSRQGKFTIRLRTRRSRLKRALTAFWAWCKKHRHDTLADQRLKLNQKLRGHYNYYGLSTNYWSLARVYRVVVKAWKWALNRRGNREPLTWKRMNKILKLFPLVRPYIKPRPSTVRAI